MADSSGSLASKRNTQLATNLIFIVLGMVMLSYAAVPLYRMFCQVTGFGGTTQTGEALPKRVLARQMTVSFNADIDTGLPWRFRPLQLQQTFHIGENVLAAYEAENLTDAPITAMATYNVTPFEAGRYFHKIECFCFNTQTLGARARVNMPISYYIDPAIDDDPHLKGVKLITLSYTFFNQSSKN